MKNEAFLNKIINDLKENLHFLEDKPEENAETTAKALWFAAKGLPVSAEKAAGLDLPEINEEETNRLVQLMNLRINNVPLAHITKRQSFMGIEFITDNRALIPRRETEILCTKALELANEITNTIETANVFDVCCGAGNLGVAISYLNSKCKVFASDISEEAVELTRENAVFLNQKDSVQVKQSDLFSAFESDEFYGKINLIVCNPPYISSAKVVKMNPEIASNEPVLAFDGGMMGIKIIQKLISEAHRFLTSGGWLIFEVGVGQGDFVIKLLQKTAVYGKIDSARDKLGNIRVVYAQK